MKNPFYLNELPKQEIESLGLIDKAGNYILSPEDVEALLAGRRTNLMSLKNLDASGLKIEQLDAKLSLARKPDGQVNFKLHPIYKQPFIPPLLDEDEAEALISGKRLSVDKIIPGPGKKEIVFEYDRDTREFISYDPGQVIAPDKINGYKLKDWQKDDFQKGLNVRLPDGTELQHRATDPKGIRADRAALILSILLDGGISYLLIRGLRHLLNSDKQQQADEQTPAFKKAYAEMEKHFAKKFKSADQQTEETRGYNKTRAR
jgi:hypothetical protein